MIAATVGLPNRDSRATENQHIEHEHYKTLLANLSRQLEHLFADAVEGLNASDLDVVLGKVQLAAQTTQRHSELEAHVTRWWSRPRSDGFDHVTRCPLCYSNTLEMVEATSLRPLLPEHRFSVVYRVDGSWFQTDSYANAYPYDDESRRMALGAIVLEDQYEMIRFANGERFIATPAYSQPPDAR